MTVFGGEIVYRLHRAGRSAWKLQSVCARRELLPIGLTLGTNGAILVDDHLCTSHPDIYVRVNVRPTGTS